MTEFVNPLLENEETQIGEGEQDVLEKILNWSESLPDWQSDAVRRILQHGELSDQDVQEALALLKAAHGLTHGSTQVSAKRLTKDDTPRRSTSGVKVALESLGDVRNVNALVPDQKITFNKCGLTTVFGRNATGKSGYARILKKACRARGDKKPILPDVFSESKPSGPAQATIGIYDGGKNIEFPWIDGKPSCEELASMAVFDSQCARVYVDEANGVFYVPYGLDVFDKLSKLCEKLRTLLQEEGAVINIDRRFLDDLKGETPLGKMVVEFSSSTNPVMIEDLSKLSEADAQQLEELEKKLAEIRVNDPKLKARQLRVTRDRILRLADALKIIESRLSVQSIEAVKNAQAEAMAAGDVAQQVSQKSFKEEPLAGVASDPWKAMFLAAKEYSEQHAYKGDSFPTAREEARCVLCFQKLTPEAADRLKRFWDFIEGAAQKLYRAKSTDLQVKAVTIQQLQPNPLANDPSFLQELEDLDALVAGSVKECIRLAQESHKAILQCVSSKSWSIVPQAPVAPIKELQRLAQDRESRAAEYDQSAIPAEKEKLESEFKELSARKQLALRKPAVFSLLENLKRVKKIASCIADTGTTGISKKSTELMQALVTDQLKRGLEEELKFLEVDYMKLELNKIGRQGVTLHQYRLKSKTHNAVDVSDVMSEGEQRAIAIASFLAELNISQDNSGVIFDDPVSSLDHQRREKVAVRLAKEAKKRQVIVFTHEMVFLSALQEAALTNGVDHFIQTVWATKEAGAGNCDPNPPWAGQSVKDRIGYLKGTLLPKLTLLSKDGSKKSEYEALATDSLRKLRQTWERAIEEVVLGQVVMRFRDSVEPTRLGSIQFTDTEDQVIADAWDRLSPYLHDEANAYDGSPAPAPDWFQNEVTVLEGFLNDLRNRAKATKDRRVWRKKLDK